MFEPIQNFFSTLLGLGVTRLELAFTELEEERIRLADMAVSACLAFFFMGLAVMLSLLFLIVFMWDTQRLLTIGLLALTFLTLGSWCIWSLRNKARRRPRFMSATLAEFRLDRELFQRPEKKHE